MDKGFGKPVSVKHHDSGFAEDFAVFEGEIEFRFTKRDDVVKSRFFPISLR
jgi:hypothetical protein